MSTTLPVWDSQTNTWSYNGHQVFSISANEMYDPETRYLMATPIADPNSLTPVVREDGFKVFTEFTYDRPETQYNPLDKHPLIPIKHVNPIYYPTPSSVARVEALIAPKFPGLTFSVTDITSDILGAPLMPGFQITNPDTGKSFTHAVGPIAHNISIWGVDTAAKLLGDELIREGVV